jgi:hypothetical protein
LSGLDQVGSLSKKYLGVRSAVFSHAMIRRLFELLLCDVALSQETRTINLTTA